MFCHTPCLVFGMLAGFDGLQVQRKCERVVLAGDHCASACRLCVPVRLHGSQGQLPPTVQSQEAVFFRKSHARQSRRFFLQIMSLERQNAEASVSRLSKTGIMSLQLLQAHEIGSI